MGSSWFGPFFVLRFGVSFLMLLGVSWSRFGAPLASFWVILGSVGPVLGRLGLSWARFRPLRGAFWSPITLYAHQFINSSTVQPMACQHFATRAGGLREAIRRPLRSRQARVVNQSPKLSSFLSSGRKNTPQLAKQDARGDLTRALREVSPRDLFTTRRLGRPKFA